MATLGPSYILEQNDFSNSESPCDSDASHRLGSIRIAVWEKMSLKNFKMAAMAAILNVEME